MASTQTRSNGKTTKRNSTKEQRETNRNPDSVPAQLESLEVGESLARGARIQMDDFAQDTAKEWFDKTTRVLSMQVARTKEANPKRDYTIERTQGIASTAPYILCAILVTRTV